MNPNTQRLAVAGVAIFMVAQFANILAQSPLQLLLALALTGAVLGFLFRTGHRHLITGYAIGLGLTLFMDFMMAGMIIRITGPIYAAGYLFAAAAGLTARFLRVQLPAYWASRKASS